MENILINYKNAINGTDKFRIDEITPVLLGLYGEVGSVLSNYKKRLREGDSFIGYHEADIEEFGDILWYFTAICDRFKIDIETVFSNGLTKEEYELFLEPKNFVTDDPKNSENNIPEIDLGSCLIKLGEIAASFLPISLEIQTPEKLLYNFATCYANSLKATKIPLEKILKKNIQKTRGRFVAPQPNELPTFDLNELPEEQIPENFEITITQRKSGKTHLQWRGVFIGDPLSDNIKDKDDYRFHDVFHFSYAAILHWSPVFRALIKQKRKSNADTDEEQDSGRALVVEEGLTAWIFSQAKFLKFFEDPNTLVSFDMLKTIEQFVAGYEVDKCPLYLWEKAIIEGYKVFRLVRDNKGGIVVCDKINRTISYRPLEGK